MSLNTGELLNNRYRIVKLLGEGGFGAVYRAWDLSLKRACALKENFDISPEAQRQFTREATVLAGLTHTNLPRVTDHFVIAGQGQYLVMDFVEGMDLGTLVQSQGAVMPNQAVSWIVQIAGALEYLHSQPSPIIHRDIKPANIRIRLDGSAVLVDFGLVKVYDARLRTTIGARAVTPGYAPPEQYGQGTTDPRTDIYALGATLYTLLTGIEPPESVQRMAGTPLTPANQLNAHVPIPTSKVIERAMALQPNQRFQTITDFKNAILATISQPIPVQPISTGVPGSVQASPLMPPSAATPLVNPQTGSNRTRGGWMLWILIPFALLGLLALLAGGGYLVTIPLRPTPTARVITATPDRSATREAEATLEAMAEQLDYLRGQTTAQADTISAQQENLAAMEANLNQAYNEVANLQNTLAAGTGGTTGGGSSDIQCPEATILYLDQFYSSSFASGDSHCFMFNAVNSTPYNVIVGGDFDTTMRLYNSSWNQLDYSDDTGPGLNPFISFTATYSGEYYLLLNGFSDSSHGDYRILIRNQPLDPVFLDENYIGANETVRGVIYENTWVDMPSIDYRVRGILYYYYEGIAGQTIQIDVFGPSINSDIDPYVELYDSFGYFLDSDDDSGVGYDSLLTYTLPESGGCYILVRSLGDRYGNETNFFFDLLVTVVTP